MIKFNIKLADIPIEIIASYEHTRYYCKEYFTDETPLFSVTVNKSHIEKVQKYDDETVVVKDHIKFSKADRHVEKLALCIPLLENLIKYNILMFHGAVVAINGKAYIFTAKSGTGKTTHAKLWLKNFPNCHILNGDKPLLLFKEGNVFVCGSPWMGKEKYGVNEIIPLEAVCILERDTVNRIEKITPEDCINILMTQCHVPNGKGNILTAFNLIQQLSSVRLYRLGCNEEDEAAFVSFKAMVKE